MRRFEESVIVKRAFFVANNSDILSETFMNDVTQKKYSKSFSNSRTYENF